ncbi:SagB/ThcOx family dehydrogenase [Streptococcus suis]
MNIENNSCIKVGKMLLYEVFHRNTALTFESAGTFVNSINSYYEIEKKNRNKLNSLQKLHSGQSIDVIYSDTESYSNLRDLFDGRKSSRDFKPLSVPKEVLFNLLRLSIGGKEKLLPNYPISGGIESFRIIIVITNVESIDNGVYEYDRKNEQLCLISSNFKKDDYSQLTLSKDIAQQSAFSIHILADCSNKCLKYQDRGYRFLLLEAGHLAQNFYLVSNAMNLGIVASGGFLDFGFKSVAEQTSDFIELELLYELFFGLI